MYLKKDGNYMMSIHSPLKENIAYYNFIIFRSFEMYTDVSIMFLLSKIFRYSYLMDALV
jgi:hypothetical protein